MASKRHPVGQSDLPLDDSTAARKAPPPSKLRLQNETIQVPIHLRDDEWSSGIGSLQRSIDNWSSASKRLVFDFRQCRWIDPLPAISLLLEMATAKQRGFHVKAIFPAIANDELQDETISAENIEIYPQSPNKFLRFFAGEGYFSCLHLHSIEVELAGQALTDALIEKCGALNVTPAYADASFIRFHLLDVPRLEQITGKVDDPAEFAARTTANLLSDVDRLLHTRCSPSERHHLLYTLRAVIQEFLHNAQEHAYTNDGFRPVGLYVRYRKGGVGLSSTQEQHFHDECINQEQKHCQAISGDWIRSRKGCLEVFFIDRGIGISKTLPAQDRVDRQFDRVMRKTFQNGESSKAKETRTTQHGGLHLLHILLSRRNDYIRAIEDTTWFGSSVPFGRPSAQVTQRIDGVAVGEGLIGLAYHIRLSWKASTDESGKWLPFSEDEGQAMQASLALSFDPKVNPLGDAGLVIDDRFESQQLATLKGLSGAYLLWLPKRNLMKWDVLSRLSEIAGQIAEPCRLVIADIPSIEAAVYEAAISKSNFDRRTEWPKKFEWLVLATNRWSFAYATHISQQSGFHGFSPLSASEIPDQFTSGLRRLGKTASFRQLVVTWLKLHDSKCFWAQTKKSGRLFLPERVIWSEDENHNATLTIDGYLDFPAATHDRYCAQLFRNALARVFGLYPRKAIEFMPVDSLAAPVIHEVYAHESFDTPMHEDEPAVKLAVGSVLVSGATLGATGLQDSSIHFFVHPMSPLADKSTSLFYWMPEDKVHDAKEPQRRIGKTSAIAPEGWLSIEMPRYDGTGNVVGGRSPADSYDDWQSPGPVIVKAGHWCYENHHDFLTINIPDAVDDAFARNGPLAQFLVRKVLHHLGVRQSDIKAGRFDLPAASDATPGILVYRSHPSIERILERILGVLEERVLRDVMRWIFPVLPLRMRWGGSTLLLPPRTNQEIREALRARKRVLVIDDAAISGRTIQDLMTSLRDFGAAPPVSILAIVNRLRLPAETPGVDYYWRLDVPTMGREGSCPLCQALSIGKSFSTALIKPSAAYGTFTQWLYAWQPVSPLNKWHAGLDPLPLATREQKNYCYSPKEKRHRTKVSIYRSTGLMVHAAELHAMTATDDYGLKKLRKQDDPAIKIGIAASQLLLFGDEFDHDILRDLVIEGLLDPMAGVPSNSPYGPLALLMIMKTLAGLPHIHHAIAHYARQEIDRLSVSQHGQLFLAFLVSQDIVNWTEDAFHSGRRLLSTRHRNVADKLRSLFRETLTPMGRHHSEPIPRLGTALRDGGSPSSDQIWAALNSIASLKGTLSDLGTDLVMAREEDGGPSYEDRRMALVTALDKATDQLIKLRDNIDGNRAVAGSVLAEVEKHLTSVLDCYFYKIDTVAETGQAKFATDVVAYLNGMSDWDEFIATKEISLGQPQLRLSIDSCSKSDFGSATSVWVAWTRPVVHIIRDLALNCAYRPSGIADPWSPTGETTDAWVHVRFYPERVEISFANSCPGSNRRDPIFEEVRRNTRNKTRWDHIRQLGGDVFPTKNLSGGNLFGVTIMLPYAAFIAQADGGRGEV